MANDSSPMGHSVELSAWQCVAPYLALGALSLLVYFPALQGGLLWGDAEQLTRPDLRSLGGLQRIWFEPGATPGYAPLLHTFYWLQYQLWNDAVLGYHLASVLQHAWAAGLIFALVRRLELPGALLAAAIFAVHPIATESVAWIAQQGNPLSAVFFLAAALLYVGYDRERIMWQYDVAFAFFVLALLTHPGTAMLPCSLLLLFWAERGALDWRRDLVPLLPWFALGAVALGVTAWLQSRSAPVNSADDFSLAGGLLVSAKAFWFYLRATFWPSQLVFIHPGWTAGVTVTLAPLAALLAFFALLSGLARRFRAPLAGVLVFVVTLLPALGLLNAPWRNISFVADRFVYLASVGVIIPVAVGICVWRARLTVQRRRGLAAVGVVLGLGLIGLGWRHSARFRDAETLYRHTLAHNPDAWLAHHELGAILLTKPGGMPSALAHFRQAIALNPSYAPAYRNLGRALAKIPGELPNAILAYERAIRLQNNWAEAHVDYGDALVAFPERMPEALAAYQRALSLDSESARAHYHFGRALARLPGRQSDATAAYERAVQLDSTYVDAYRSLGDALAADDSRTLDAIAAYQGALHVQPLDIELRHKLAAVFARSPARVSEALEEYRKILQLSPQDDAAHAAIQRLRPTTEHRPDKG